jgi:hypothetical protein
MQDTVKAQLSGKFIAMSVYIEKNGSPSKKLMMQGLGEKKEQAKPQITRMK